MLANVAIKIEDRIEEHSSDVYQVFEHPLQSGLYGGIQTNYAPGKIIQSSEIEWGIDIAKVLLDGE
jgi:hypothetical protein